MSLFIYIRHKVNINIYINGVKKTKEKEKRKQNKTKTKYKKVLSENWQTGLKMYNCMHMYRPICLFYLSV